MKLEKREIKKEWQPEKIDLLQLFNARCDEAARLTAELRKESIDEDTADAVRKSLNSITEEAEKIASLLDNWDKPAAEPDGGERAFNPLATMEMRTLGSMDFSSGKNHIQTKKEVLQICIMQILKKKNASFRQVYRKEGRGRYFQHGRCYPYYNYGTVCYRKSARRVL